MRARRLTQPACRRSRLPLGRKLSYPVAIVLALQSATAAELSDQQANRRPRIRIASSPYPNPLFRLLNSTEDFRRHHYRRQFRVRNFERSRGHLYTRRGGMIDLSHLRKTVDWAAWLQASIYRDLLAGERDLVYRCSEPSRYHLRVALPVGFEAMTEVEQQALLHSLSVETALVTAYYALTWHEILTWYGWGAVPGLSERQSAFSIEDTYTHALGIEVARRALNDDARPYDEAVAAAIRELIESLEPQSKEEARRMLAATKGKWWRYARTLKRNPYIGYGRPITPVLSPCHPCDDPVALSAPRLPVVDGIDYGDLVTIEIDPVVRKGREILTGLENGRDRILPTLDFAPIMEAVRDAIPETLENASETLSER